MNTDGFEMVAGVDYQHTPPGASTIPCLAPMRAGDLVVVDSAGFAWPAMMPEPIRDYWRAARRPTHGPHRRNLAAKRARNKRRRERSKG